MDQNLGVFKDFGGTETGQRGWDYMCLCHARLCCFLSQTDSASMSSFCQLATSTPYGLTRRLCFSRRHCCCSPRPRPPLSTRPPTLILSARVSNARRPCKLQYESFRKFEGVCACKSQGVASNNAGSNQPWDHLRVRCWSMLVNLQI